MRQGCIFTPTHFTLCIDQVTGETVEKNDCGTSLKDARIIDLALPDEIASSVMNFLNFSVWRRQYLNNQALTRIMGYRWDSFVSNERVIYATGKSQVTSIIRLRQLPLFSHLVKLPGPIR